jgi:hypothetical protein
MIAITPMIFVRTIYSLFCAMAVYYSQGLSYSAIIIRVGLGIAERGNGSSSPPISSLQFTSRLRNHAHANTLAISVDQDVSVSGDGVSAHSDDPVDDLSANIHGDKLGRPWEAPPWHPRLPAR